jgi:5-methylcytosine-specific restriction protein A
MPWPTGPTRTSTPQHRAWAAQVKANAQGRCQIQAPGCEGTADHADHILAVTEGGAEYDVSNGQGACTHCHAIKTGEERQRGRDRTYGRAKHPTEQHPGMMTP